MKYYALNEGNYNNKKVSNDDLWESFAWLFNKSSSHDTSYKFIFFRSLLDCIDYNELRIDFDLIFERFIYYSWSLILKYHIRQKSCASDGRLTELENILNEFLNDISDGCYLSWMDIDSNNKKAILKKVKKACKKYVVGAFYGDTKELAYSFSKKDEWIDLNPFMYDFMRNNKKILLDLNYNKWAKFYSNINSEKLEEKLKLGIEQSMARLGENVYRTILAYEYETIHNKSEVISSRENIMEMLYVAESVNNKKTSYDLVEAEEELYRDFSDMKDYLKDPIQLLDYIKKKKGFNM